MPGTSQTRIRLFHPPVCPEVETDRICQRLYSHLAEMRSRKTGSPSFVDLNAVMASMSSFETHMNVHKADVDALGLEHRDRKRILVRAKRLFRSRSSANRLSLGHLCKERDSEDRAALLRLAGMVPVRTVADEAAADELAASLHAEFPWMGAATTAVWHAIRRCARRGRPIGFGPLLLVGPPGIGKTAWACALSKALDLPHCVIDAGQGLSSMALAGTERGWSGQQPGRPLQTVMSSRIANPVIVVDEVDKEVVQRTASGISLAFQSSLLGLMEPGSARNWQCPYYRIGVDMSHLSWVLTANEIRFVSEHVRSRCEIVRLGDLSVEELSGFAERQATRRGLPAAAADAVRHAIERLATNGRLQRRLSLRDVSRMLGRAEELVERPTMH